MRRQAARDEWSRVSGQRVDVDNFKRAETDRMFASLVHDAGGVNRLLHGREPTPLDHQPVIRMNRDTLYSFVIVDMAQGATLTLPDAGERYLSAMIVNEDHYINDVFHDAGTYELTQDRYGTPYVAVAVRILVDPADPSDVAEVGRLQDQLRIEAVSNRPFVAPDHDTASLDAVRAELQAEARGGFDSLSRRLVRTGGSASRRCRDARFVGP